MNAPARSIIAGSAVDAAMLRAALARWCDALDAAVPELNALDARLGDGDLGTTLGKCAANVRASSFAADDIAAIFKACAQACAKASGSSFGTLLAIGFLAVAKSVGPRQTLDRDLIVEALQAAQQALAARGGATVGDKTMLDSLQALADALGAAQADDLASLKQVARMATRQALDAMRERPNRIGRARMFADASVGLDDPGMVAVHRMVQAL